MDPLPESRAGSFARLRTTTERRLAEPALDLGRRLFPRGLAALVPDERTRFLGICALVGAAAAIAAIAFRLGLRLVATGAFGSADDLVAAARLLPPWRRLIVPAAGAAVATSLARLLVSRGGGGGVAGIMEAISLKKGFVSLTSAATKAACSLFSIGSGGSIGREGPIIQLGAAVASASGRSLGVAEERLRVLVACGASAGFAAAYATPMAATLFVVEVIAGTASIELLGPAAVSAVIATALTYVTLGDGPLYGMKAFVLASPFEFIPYCILALASAIVATVFLGSLDAAEWFFARTFPARVPRAIFGGLVVGAIAIGLPYVYGNGYETTKAIVDGSYGVRFLGLLLAAKLIATAATVGSGGAGGVFTPTLLLGAALGAATGDLAHAVAPAHTAPPGAYALVGMAALLAATTHAPLLAAVFVFEVTRDYAIVLPLLFTGFVAASFAKALRPKSIYEEEAERRGVALERNLEERALRSLRAGALARPTPSVPGFLPLENVLEAFATSGTASLYVVGEDGRFMGVIDLHEAREALAGSSPGPEKARVAAALARAVPTVAPEATGREIEEALYRSGRDEVPVVAPGGRFVGIVSRGFLAAAVDREVIRRSLLLKESMAGVESRASGIFSLPASSRIEQVRVPRSLEGKRIAEARIRERFGLNILAIVKRRQGGGEERSVPGGESVLEPGGELVVIGLAADIARFRGLE
jgi:CIC family chloride channel protein